MAEAYPDGIMLQKCKTLSDELEDLHRHEETYWFARVRANELKDEDENTSYFHHKPSSRRRRNRID